MEEVKVHKGQTIFGMGDKPDFFFRIVDGKITVKNEVYNVGDFVGFVEYFMEVPFEGDVVVLEDGAIERFREDDVKDPKIFDEVMMHIIDMINSSVSVVPGEKAVKEIEEKADVGAILELGMMKEAPEETFEILEDVMTLKKLPELPDDEKKARDFIEKLDRDVDILNYILHKLAFVKKFPDSDVSPGYLREVIEIYMDELDDRYGAKYCLKLFLVLYPDHEDLHDVLLRLVKVLKRSNDPEWFEYYERLLITFPDSEVKYDEIS